MYFPYCCQLVDFFGEVVDLSARGTSSWSLGGQRGGAKRGGVSPITDLRIDRIIRTVHRGL